MCLRGAINVPSTTVSGTVAVGGVSPPSDGNAKGYFSLRNAAGDDVMLGSARSYSTGVIPGTYDLTFTPFSDGSSLVTNSGFKLRSGIVVGATPVSLNVDVPATTVSGTFTVKGAALTGWQNGDGILWLRNAAGEDVQLSATSDTSFSALVIAGTYDLYFRQYRVGPAVPTNTVAKIKSGIVVGASPVSLSFDVPATTVSGAVTFNGAAVTGTDKGSYALSLRNAAGDIAQLAPDVSKGSYAGLVVPGTYDLYYAVAFDGTTVPRNESAKLQSGIVVGTSPLSLNINVPMTTVSVNATINGAASSVSSADVLSLRNAAGDTVRLFGGGAGASSTPIIPGTYDLYYASSVIPRAGLPVNRSAKIRSGIVIGSSPVTVDVDLRTAVVSGTVAVNGATISDATQGVGTLSLLTADGDSALVARTNSGSYSALVIAGTYGLVYASSTGGPAIPINRSGLLKQEIVVGTSPITLDINVPTTTVSGNITVNGASVSASSGRASLVLTGPRNDTAIIGVVPSTTSTYAALVIPGTYELFYALYGSGPAIPGNHFADLGCFTAP